MTKQIIRTGTTADPTGDSLKNAFTKVNDNFTELYNALGLDSGGPNIGAFEFTGSVMTTTDSSAITIDQAVTVTSNLEVGGDILPSINLGGNLGSPTQQWRSLYVSTNTIYINNIPLSVDSSNNLTINGTAVNAVGSAAWSAITGKPAFAAVATGGDLNADTLRTAPLHIASTSYLDISSGSNGGGNIDINALSGTLTLLSTDGTSIQSGTNTWTFGINGSFTPGTDNLQDIGTPSNRVRHVYVGPGSVYIGNNVITESATGGLVLPGVTRATGYYAEEVENEDRWGSNPTITGTVTVIDATRYQILAGQTPSAGYTPATYTVEKDGNRVDEINVSSGGSGWTKAEADYARDNNMYATNVAGAINNFNAGNWQQIPFRVEIKAEDTEYEDIFGGANLGDLVIDSSNIYSDTSGNFVNLDAGGAGWMRLGTLNNEKLQLIVNYDEGGDAKVWEFGTDGNLTLPEGGDILDSNGDSVLGGGSTSYTPDDSDNWDSPTVNTIAAALDELAAKVAALENFEIDGGNAYTPAAGELTIDGNGA